MLLSEIVNLNVMKIMIMIGIYSKKGPANAWYIIFLHCKHRIYKKKYQTLRYLQTTGNTRVREESRCGS